MKSITILDAYKRTQEIYGDELPKIIVNNINGSTHNLTRIKILANNYMYTKDTVILGGVIGINGVDVAKDLMNNELSGKINTVLIGPLEYLILNIFDAIDKNDSEDIFFYMNILIHDPVAKGFFAHFGLSDVKKDNELEEHIKILVQNITPDIIRWLRKLPNALLFTDAKKDGSNWNGCNVLTISSSSSLAMDDKPELKILLNYYTQPPMDRKHQAGSWIPYLLFPDGITSNLVATNEFIEDKANPRAIVQVHTISPDDKLLGIVSLKSINKWKQVA